MRIILLYLFFLGLSLGAINAQNCNFLNEIAVRCISVRIAPENFKMLPSCRDTINFDSTTVKRDFVNAITKESDFINQIILANRFRILKGTTFEDIYRQIESFDVLSLMLPLAMDDQEEWQMYQDEKKRLYKVYLLSENLGTGAIEPEDCYSILFDNFFYDNQNMGDDNFINSTFQYTLGRNPTDRELQEGIKMINDTPSSLFYKKGSSKQDYLKIITSNQNFYEQQVRYWFYFFLFETPSDHLTFQILKAIKAENGKISTEHIIKHILIYHIV